LYQHKTISIFVACGHKYICIIQVRKVAGYEEKMVKLNKSHRDDSGQRQGWGREVGSLMGIWNYSP
jgi:hypothetical protein